MRTLVWLAVLLVNAGLCLLVASFVVQPDIPTVGRLVAGLAAIAVAAVLVLLVLARVGHLPTWGILTMRGLCVSYAVLWFLGSLDHGIVSGQELWSVILVTLFAWGTWRAFMLFAKRGLTHRSSGPPSAAAELKR